MCFHVEGKVSKDQLHDVASVENTTEKDGEKRIEVTPETLDTSNLEATDEESNAMIECNAKATRSSKDNVHEYDDDTVEGPDDKSNTKVNIADDGDDCVLNNDFTEAKTLFEGTFIENYAAILKTLKMFPEAEIKDDDCKSPRNLFITEQQPQNNSTDLFDEYLDQKNCLKNIDGTKDTTKDCVKTSLQDSIVTQEFVMSEDKSVLELSGSSHLQTDIEGSLCSLYSSTFSNFILMHCVVSTVYTVYRVFLALVKLAEVQNADYKVDEFDNKPVHKLQEDLSDKSEECGAKLKYLDAIHTVPGMLDPEERRTYFNHRLACSQINYIRYLKLIPLVNDDTADPRKLMLVTVPELLGNLVLVPAPKLCDELVRVPPLPGELPPPRESLLKLGNAWSATPAPFRTCLGCSERGGRSCAARPAPATRTTSTSVPGNLWI